ncbi:MAG TPA: 2'-5' RNA ligase family protein [Candidatus Paceibacterota bacterium]|nr:2'-5' RNA ligase family protein [Candidatus Paceibacterota bacterium]
MREVFIGILMPPSVASALAALQARAQELVQNRPGCEALTISHGKSPFHLTLVSPFRTRSSEQDSRLEHKLTRFSQRHAPFTFQLELLGVLQEDTVCLLASDRNRFTAFRATLHSDLGHPILRPQFFPHVSVARKFPAERFTDVRDACAQAYCEQSAALKLSVSCSGLTVFGKQQDVWQAETSYHLGGKQLVA